MKRTSSSHRFCHNPVLKVVNPAVEISELGDGRRRVSVTTSQAHEFVLQRECETAYPVELIELISRIKGPGSLCDEILREESAGYVQRGLHWLILSHVDPDEVGSGTILDFGCGGGASTMILARMFPRARIVGVDIDPAVMSIAHARRDHYGYENVELHLAKSAERVGEDIGPVDGIVLFALYEHLLPLEREVLMGSLWQLLVSGGVLFVGETPHRYSPIELHTTGLPLINYLPDGLTLRAARAFSPRVPKNARWDDLLRRGIRGATRAEIIAAARRGGGGEPVVLVPNRLGVRDAFDLWYVLAGDYPPLAVKRLTRSLLQGLHAVTGVTFTPHVAFALRKNP